MTRRRKRSNIMMTNESAEALASALHHFAHAMDRYTAELQAERKNLPRSVQSRFLTLVSSSTFTKYVANAGEVGALPEEEVTESSVASFLMPIALCAAGTEGVARDGATYSARRDAARALMQWWQGSSITI